MLLRRVKVSPSPSFTTWTPVCDLLPASKSCSSQFQATLHTGMCPAPWTDSPPPLLLEDDYTAAPRPHPISHPPVEAPICPSCINLDLSFFDPSCAGCSAILRSRETRQWNCDYRKDTTTFSISISPHPGEGNYGNTSFWEKYDKNVFPGPPPLPNLPKIKEKQGKKLFSIEGGGYDSLRKHTSLLFSKRLIPSLPISIFLFHCYRTEEENIFLFEIHFLSASSTLPFREICL